MFSNVWMQKKTLPGEARLQLVTSVTTLPCDERQGGGAHSSLYYIQVKGAQNVLENSANIGLL